MLSKSSKCVHTSVPEKVLLTVHLQIGKLLTALIFPSWENSIYSDIYSDHVQHHTNQVEFELEMGVVYADLVDYVKIMMMLRKGGFFLFCFSFICVLKTTFMRKSPKLGVMCFKRFFLCDLAHATASFI